MEGSTITLLVAILAMGITIMGFQWRQNAAMERWLREDSRELERRLREDSRELERRLREDINSVAESVESAKIELRSEIKAVEERLVGRIKTVEGRLDITDSDVKILIGEVGLVKGAVLGVSAETNPREPAATN